MCFLELSENIDLISMEKLDRGSPEIWPEKSNYKMKCLETKTTKLATPSCFILHTVPGVAEFSVLNSISNRDETIPSWTRGLSQEDINTMHRNYYV